MSAFDLRTARLNKGLSRRAAALEIGVPRETLRRLEGGARIHPANAKKVADFYGIAVTDLMPVDTNGGPTPGEVAA